MTIFCCVFCTQGGMCLWRSHVYYHFFVGHSKPDWRVCGQRWSDQPFGQQPQLKVAKIVKNWSFWGFLACQCSHTAWLTGLGHMSPDTLGHCPSLLFCTIFFPSLPWPWWPFKVAWVKIDEKPIFGGDILTPQSSREGGRDNIVNSVKGTIKTF